MYEHALNLRENVRQPVFRISNATQASGSQMAGQFLALDHAHKVAGRLDLEHLLFLEANAAALLSAAHAEPLEPEHFRSSRFSCSRRSASCALCASALDERSRFLRQTLKIDAGNRFERHLLISCLAISNKHDT